MNLLIHITQGFSEAAGEVKVVSIPNGGGSARAKKGSDGTIHLCYQVKGQIWYARSMDDGATFGTPIPVIDPKSPVKIKYPPLEFTVEDLAVGKNERVHIVLTRTQSAKPSMKEEWGVYYTNIDPSSASFKPLKNLAQNVMCDGFSVAVNSNGNVAVHWLTPKKIGASYSSDNGDSFGEGVDAYAEAEPCACCSTSAAYGSDGKLVFIYREQKNNDRDMYMVLRPSTGSPIRQKISTTPWKINSCPNTDFNLTGTDTGYVAIWPTKGEVFFTKLDLEGKIIPPGEIKTPGRSPLHSGTLSLIASNGDTFIGWNNGGQLGWQIYDEKGLPKGTPGSATTQGKSIAGVLNKNSDFLVFH